MWTEAQVIEEIARQFPPRPDIAPLGIGDDCAVVSDGQNLITTDASVESVHFDLSWMSLADAAYRCLAANLSDVASMGAEPGCFTLALCLRPDLSFESIREAIGALRQCISDHGLKDCWLIGGDVVRSGVVSFSITMLGKKPDYPLATRGGACHDDVLAVLGNMGYSAAGLEICRRNLMYADEMSEYRPFLEAFKRPRAHCALGISLVSQGLIHGMMDTSDGIMLDLPRMLSRSGCGAIVDVNAFRADLTMENLARELHVQSRAWMVCGGEDFGLLVAISRDKMERVKSVAASFGVSFTELGRFSKSIRGIRWMDGAKEVQVKNVSFVHFA